MDLGLFLGGAAEGMQARAKQDNLDAQTAETARSNLESERLARDKFAETKRSNSATETLQKAKLRLAELEMQGSIQDRANRTIGDLVGAIKETTTQLRAAGKTQSEIEAAVAPLAAKTLSLTGRLGVDPDLIAARISSITASPGTPATEIAKLEVDRRNGFISDEDYRKKVDALSKGGGTTINVGDKAANSFAGELNKKVADDFVERRKAAIDAMGSIESNNVALGLINQGIITGTGADVYMQFGKALQAAGIEFDKDRIRNTEAFVATRANEVGRLIKMFGAGTGLSDGDRAYATAAAAGNVSLTEASIRRIIEINQTAARNVIRAYNNDVAKIDPGAVPFDLRLPEGPTSSAATPVRKTLNGVTYEKRGNDWYQVDAPLSVPRGR